MATYNSAFRLKLLSGLKLSEYFCSIRTSAPDRLIVDPIHQMQGLSISESPPHRDQPGRDKGERGRLIGRVKGGMNTELNAICDSRGRLLNLFVTAGQVSDYIGERALLSSLPKVDWLLGDRGCDAVWFRDALKDKGIRACIPGRKQRKTPVKYDKRRYKRRNRIEIMFRRLKDWRRVATRYDRCPEVFLSAIALTATVIYWL